MITVVMTTWDDGTGIRLGYANQSVLSLLDHIEGTEARGLCLADDGTENAQEKFDHMLEWADESWGSSVLVTSVHNGIGSSLNHALNIIDDLWLYTVDDWLLTGPLNLDPAVKLLRIGYDYVRLGPIHPNLECITRFQTGIGYWLDLCNTGGFAFATRPFLATKQFYEKVGPFMEGANSYVVEQDYSMRCARKTLTLKMASIELNGPWETIGDSYPVGAREV